MTSSDSVSPESLAASNGAKSTDAPVMHGGDLGAARAQFPNAPEPIVDLSTGVNPHPYPIGALTGDDFARLPEPAALTRLAGAAAALYGAPAAENVAAAPGSQILMALIAESVPRGRAAILGPTYAEHARVAALAGHDVTTVAALPDLAGPSLAVVVNPNNPDGRVTSRADLLRIAAGIKAQGGILVVDEAFMEVGPQGESVAGDVDHAPLAVLRSFGKFFGLAGMRLSFALASRDLAARLRARLGPWPVSGPALAIGTAALGDQAWIERTQERLAADAARLERLLRASGLTPVGRTDLFCLVSSPRAAAIYAALGAAGIFVRRFEEHPRLLRFGLPGKETEWHRLNEALQYPL